MYRYYDDTDDADIIIVGTAREIQSLYNRVSQNRHTKLKEVPFGKPLFKDGSMYVFKIAYGRFFAMPYEHAFATSNGHKEGF